MIKRTFWKSLNFSESALIKYRVHVEIEYFIALYKLPLDQMSGLEERDKDIVEKIRDIYRNFSMKDAEEIKKIEKVHFLEFLRWPFFCYFRIRNSATT